LSHRECVALAGRVYQACASEERRETTAAMERVPVVTGLKPGEAARESRWQPPSGSNLTLDALA
jgi:hypothetical protein